MHLQYINTLPAAVFCCCRPLITFANSLDPDQAWQITPPTILTLWWYSWNIKKKQACFEKISRRQKSYTITQHAKSKLTGAVYASISAETIKLISQVICLNPKSATNNLQQTTISNFATFSKITLRHDISWEAPILFKCHSLFFSKIGKDVAKFVVCCSRDWRFKG